MARYQRETHTLRGSTIRLGDEAYLETPSGESQTVTITGIANQRITTSPSGNEPQHKFRPSDGKGTGTSTGYTLHASRTQLAISLAVKRVNAKADELFASNDFTQDPANLDTLLSQLQQELVS